MSNVSEAEAGDLARAVLDQVTGECDVRVARIAVNAGPPTGEARLSVDIALTMAVNFSSRGNLLCLSRYELTATPVDDDKRGSDDGAVAETAEGDTSTVDKPIDDQWDAMIEVHGMWKLESREGLTGEHAQAFALAVGAMTLHPYARAHLQSAVAATGYPGYTLQVLSPLLRADDEGVVDLDQVGFLSGTPGNDD